MKIEYKESGDPGYGELVFSEAILPDPPWQVAIQRGSDQGFLSASAQKPWVSEIYFNQLTGSVEPDGSLALNVGPEIVDRLDQQDSYRIQIKGEDGNILKGMLKIPSIAHSAAGSLNNTARAKQEGKPVPEIKKPSPQPKPEAAPNPGPEKLEMVEQTIKHSPGMRLIRWGLLGLLVIACFCWYWFDPRNHEPQEQPAPVAPLSVEDQVRNFFKGERMSPLAAAELAARLPKNTPQEQDAVYRLYYYAADNGEPSALFPYAQALDPSMPAFGTIEKDAPEAWNAYRKAPDQDKAAKAMTQLRGWLEDESQRGNREAANWLREIER